MSLLHNERRNEIEPRSTVAVRLQNVCKSYKMYDRPLDLMKEALTGRSHHREKQVLRDISASVMPGEIVGIIGRNGAGKSTLLKIIAGTLAATSGEASIAGRVSAILELGTGFNPNYSGRDNVILSALMRGMPEPAIRKKFEEVVAFAGLENVIDEPFHTYSSGMQARLAFAAATAVEADILIIDEALAVGDARFAARSFRRIQEICKTGVTALFVSHQSYHVMQLCSRAIWIDDGRIRMDGEPIGVVRAYEYDIHEAIARDQGRMQGDLGSPNLAAAQISNPVIHSEVPLPAADVSPETQVENPGAPPAPCLTPESVPDVRAETQPFSSGEYRIVSISFMDSSGKETDVFRFGDKLRLRVGYECLLSELPPYSCGLAVAFNRVSDFEAVMYFNTNYPHSDDEVQAYFDAAYRKYIGRRGTIEAVIDPLQLRAGEYYVSLGILPNRPEAHEFYAYLHCHFRVHILPNGFDEPSVFYPVVSWTNARSE
jgi:ABC-type polysaccharide/polyol phosphate transport system ATPase subunit